MNTEGKMLLLFGSITSMMLIGGVLLLSNNSSNGSDAVVAGVAVDQSLLVRENSHKTASDSAKVTIVEFADFECPACGFAYPLLKQIIAEYDERINFVYRHFPLPQHRYGEITAIYAEAAGRQGKFWEMYGKLYENQEIWSERNDPATALRTYAVEIEFNMEQFEKDIKDPALKQLVQSDKQDGLKLGVNSTPTLFINGEKVVGVPSYEELKEKIDRKLAE